MVRSGTVGRTLLDRAVVLTLLGAAFPLVGGPHDLTRVGRVWVPGASSTCAVCHATHGGEVRSLTLRPRSLTPQAFQTRAAGVSDRNLACLRCHTRWSSLRQELPDLQGSMPESRFLGFDLTDDHPVDVRAPEPIGLGRDGRVPLEESRLLCVTCHEPHRSEYPALLRRPVPEICQECHTAADVHYGHSVSACATCHRLHGAALPHLLEPAKTRTACVACHSEISPDHPAGSPPPRRPARALQPMRPPTDAPGPSPIPPPEDLACSKCHRFHELTRGGPP
jgi:predicted CXXCH cytochrome family protein